MQIRIDRRSISDFKSMMKTIQKFIYLSWGKDKISFFSAYPKKEIKSTPIITYKIDGKSPGKFGNITEIKPRIRETITIKDQFLMDSDDEPLLDENGDRVISDGDALEIWGQTFDYTIKFEVWGRDGEEADEIAANFQKFMFKYTGYLKKNGVQEILFKDLYTDTSSNKWKTDLINRTLIYHIRIDEIAGIFIPSIENIDLDFYSHDSTYGLIVDLYLREQIEDS